MAQARLSTPGEKLRSALGALVAMGLVGWLLTTGLAMRAHLEQAPATRLLDFAMPPPPEPEPTPSPSKATPREEGRAAPPNRISHATEVVAPLPTPLVQPLPAATQAAQGSQATSGAALVAGPGTGAGGAGNGTGSGGTGNGPGGGGTALRLLKGDITGRDYPRAAAEAGASGTVGLRFTVGVKGRVTDCAVTRSSGNAELDATTCRLILKRFRYEPSRDAQDRPYPDTVTGEQVWELYDRPGERGGN